MFPTTYFGFGLIDHFKTRTAQFICDLEKLDLQSFPTRKVMDFKKKNPRILCVYQTVNKRLSYNT